MAQPVIGLTLDHEPPGGYSKFPWYAIRENYCNAVRRAGGLPILLPHDPDAASDYLDRIDLQADFRELAEKSDDAFDAAISALVMSRHVEPLRNLRQAASPITLLEGAIWEPTVK